jgi:hypothetical protein
MIRAGLAALFSVCVAATVAAQSATVSGIVVDARTGQPLTGVVISIDRLPASITTDAAGRFQVIADPGEYNVTASLVGYALTRQPLTVTAGENPPLTIRLPEGAGRFEEHVTVSGARAGESEAVSGGTFLHGRELQALRGITLDDPLRALQAVPSVAATDDFYSEFAVRGSPFRHVGLVVDGIPTRYLMHSVHGVADGGSIAMINSDAVGGVSLLPGGYPQRWGRRVGAQVGVDVREGDRERLRARMGLSGTSATILAEGPLAGTRGSWLVSGRRSYLDLLLKRIDDDNSLAFGFTDAGAKAVVDLTPRHQLQALLITGASTFEEEPNGLTANDEAEVKGRTWLSGVTWRFAPSPRFALTQRLYATGLTFRNRNRDGGVLDTALAAEWGWRADATASAKRGILLEVGADAQRLSGRHHRQRALDDAPAALTTIADYRQTGRAFSAYAQAVLGSPSRIAVTPGLRVDQWGPTTASSASPWLTADVALSPRTRLRAGAGVYRQFADFEQIAGVHGGGEGLRPETARHVDVGVWQRMPREVTLQATVYRREESDILWTPGAEPRRLADGAIHLGRGDAPWTNSLDGRAQGFEVVLRRDAPARFSGWAGYAFGRYRLTNVAAGETFWGDYDQRHAITLFGYYRVSNRTALGAKFRYGSNYPIAGYIGELPFAQDAPLFGGTRPVFYGLAEARNTLRLPSYARLDLRADRTFTWAGRRMTLFGEVANALNRQNLRNVPYGIDRAGRVQGPTDSLLPFLPSAGFVIEF